MNGTLEIESEEGKGSTFIVTLLDIAISSVEDSEETTQDVSRDMIFEGYTIIYKIDKKTDTIQILEIFNKNLPQITIEDKNENN
jgi:hypothetical protein